MLKKKIQKFLNVNFLHKFLININFLTLKNIYIFFYIYIYISLYVLQYVFETGNNEAE